MQWREREKMLIKSVRATLGAYLYGWRTGSTSMIFSGFKSAWISPSCFSFSNAVKTYKAKKVNFHEFLLKEKVQPDGR